MDFAHIAELTPELQARDTKQFKAAVTLIWPWSSSQRQFALLLAEPDFRLRRKKGQVRARFSGSSAKALATTGVGIGDEVILSLRGAQFVQEGTVSTPGRSIDWELEYTQTVAVQVLRDGKEIANLDFVDAAPTPARRSPVRRQTDTVPSPMQQWSSPAFMKRARLSDGPFFEASFDPLADENAEGHDRKRRRKSYRDWKAWTYNARTPSPEKGDAGTEDDFDNLEASPSRRAQLPHTPVSPPKQGFLSGQLDGASDVLEEQVQGFKNATVLDLVDAEGSGNRKGPKLSNASEFVRDNDNHDLYAGPDDDQVADARFAFGGDTEANTEEEELEDTDAASMSPTKASTEEVEEFRHTEGEEAGVVAGIFNSGSTTEEGSFFEPPESQHTAQVIVEDTELVSLDTPAETLLIAMPPPTLPTLDTNFPTTHVAGMLTPVGKEPSSPKIQPLDSALLPLPSPFPGERDVNLTSYLDHISTDRISEQPEEDEDPPSEVSYILENSFFSSINSTKAAGFHPDHESSFTPVRFTFGIDGAGHSRPLDLSSPAPEVAKNNAKEQMQLSAVNNPPIESYTIPETIPDGPLVDNWEPAHHGETAPLASVGGEEFAPGSDTRDESKEQEELAALPGAFEAKKTTPDVIELSSDSEEEESEESEEDEETRVGETLIAEPVYDGVDQSLDDSRILQDPLDSHLSQDDHGPTSTNRSAAATDIVDLGSPSRRSDIEGTASHSPYQDPKDKGNGVATLTEMSTRFQDPNILPAEPSFESQQIHTPIELIAMDFAPANLDFPAAMRSEENTHTTSQQVIQDITDLGANSHSWKTENVEALQTMENVETVIHDSLAQDENFDLGIWVTEDVDDHHPDVKVESIEEGSIFQYSELETEHGKDNELEAGPSDKILIEVPEEGHKLGELHTISVPATGPARNTRSKTKTSTSPTKSEMSPVKRNTRSTRSKASATPVALTFDSPPKTRTHSTMSPSQEGSQTSPYSLRSQSKLLSPAQNTSIVGAATRRSQRKHASQQSVESVSDVGQSQTQSQNADPFMTSFVPSQELGTSQGRHSEVGFVKDSEEESLHSEHSLSTVRYSDDWISFTNLSDPPVEPARDHDLEILKAPPASAPNAGTRGSSHLRGMGGEQQTVLSTKSSPKPGRSSFAKQPSPSSLSRRLRSATSTEVDFTSPRSLRSSRRSARLSSSPAQQAEDFSDEATPKAQGVAHPTLFGENEVVDLRSSPPAQAVADEVIQSSPPAAATHQQSLMAKGKLITPEATQTTSMDSQSDSVTGQQQQSLLMTPQLTQTTSAGFKSFNASMADETTVVATPTKASPNVVTRSTPRHNATQTDVASPSITPKEHSPDISSDLEATAAEKPEGPSIGLSTPLAYYTPLDSLTYFLNRSSQFHTSSNPDVLALVTQGTTAPQRVTKGRKDWTTTLHITDASSWPATTTVSIFRPYQSALPAADAGDVVLLRAFAVKSLNRHPTLTSADESSWCVWRYTKPVWGAKRGAFGELRAREEIKGPLVERGEGEWREVEKLREWWVGKVKGELDGMVGTHTRSHDKKEDAQDVESQGVKTRSRDAATREG